MKLANPFYYPLAMLLGGISLVLGVRLLSLPNLLVFPTAAAVATAGATFLKSREPDPKKIIDGELRQIKILAEGVASKAELLRQEAGDILTKGNFQLDLLVAVQSVCDRLSSLPSKIQQLTQKVSDREALLSEEELNAQLLESRQKLAKSSGIAKERLQELINSLEKNIQLAKTGQDARQAQIINLHTLIQNSAGILQEFQNKLRTSNLDQSQNLQDLQELNDELNQYQENVDILID